MLSGESKSTTKIFSLTYLERLHAQRDFNRAFKSGLRLENKDIRILVYKRIDGQIITRLGLVTHKKVGTAVIRNKTKRRLREIFRTSKYLLKPGLDMVFISKPETALLNYNGLKKAILDLLKSAKLYTSLE
ncbi:MAG: ribonuclease P protein component [Endomicrobium sp.]|jgi:ribonuclease P protein component|nr:ribonuclease P protein component [Endomicrobium sp.]